jgi:hypothetical protein
MRFDFGVVGVAKGDASGEGYVTRELQFRAVTATSSLDGLGDSNPLTTPGAVELREGAGILELRVRAVSAALYEFGFRYEGVGSVEDAEKGWTTVGFGAANEVSGGFTGVSSRLVSACVRVLLMLMAILFRRSSGCMLQGMDATPRLQHILKISSMTLFPECSEEVHSFVGFIKEDVTPNYATSK